MGGGACFGLTLLTSLYVGTIFLGTAQHVIKSHVNSTLELVGGSLTPPPPPRGCDASPVQVTSSPPDIFSGFFDSSTLSIYIPDWEDTF